jgi:hypothetical protein
MLDAERAEGSEDRASGGADGLFLCLSATVERSASRTSPAAPPRENTRWTQRSFCPLFTVARLWWMR